MVRLVVLVERSVSTVVDCDRVVVVRSLDTGPPEGVLVGPDGVDRLLVPPAATVSGSWGRVANTSTVMPTMATATTTANTRTANLASPLLAGAPRDVAPLKSGGTPAPPGHAGPGGGAPIPPAFGTGGGCAWPNGGGTARAPYGGPGAAYGGVGATTGFDGPAQGDCGVGAAQAEGGVAAAGEPSGAAQAEAPVAEPVSSGDRYAPGPAHPLPGGSYLTVLGAPARGFSREPQFEHSAWWSRTVAAQVGQFIAPFMSHLRRQRVGGSRQFDPTRRHANQALAGALTPGLHRCGVNHDHEPRAWTRRNSNRGRGVGYPLRRSCCGSCSVVLRWNG